MCRNGLGSCYIYFLPYDAAQVRTRTGSVPCPGHALCPPHHDFIAKSSVFHRKPLLACQFSLWYFHNSTCIWRSVKMHLKILKESPGGKPLGLFAYLIKAAVEVLASVPQAAKQTVADAFSCAMNSTCYDNGGSYDRHGNHDSAYQVLIFFHFDYLHSVRFVMQYPHTNYTTNLQISLP